MPVEFLADDEVAVTFRAVLLTVPDDCAGRA
jgi:hypothetical protein